MPSQLISELQDQRVTKSSVAIWWLGQAGYLVKSPDGAIVVIDPYLSDACEQLGREIGFDMRRMVAAPLLGEQLVCVDRYIVTHSHLDHLDPDTLSRYRLAGGRGPFIAPSEARIKLIDEGVEPGQIEEMWPNREVRLRDISVRATFAIPFGSDDLTHVGYLLTVTGGPRIYFTGDTGYHEVIGESVSQHKPDVMVTVINSFRNLSPTEAAKLAWQVKPKVVIPCHYGMFPDNSVPPRALRTSLIPYAMQDRYRELDIGRTYRFPE